MTTIAPDDLSTIEMIIAVEFRRHVGIAVNEVLRDRATDPLSVLIEHTAEEERDNRWELLTPIMRLAESLKFPGYGDYQRAAFDIAVDEQVAKSHGP